MTDKKNRKEKNQGETKKTDKKRAKSTGKNLQVKEKKLQSQIKNLKKEAESLKEQLLRRTAELDNMRKRNEREIARIIQSANKDLIKDILSVVDDLERSLEASKKNSGEEDLLKGVELIHQKLMSVFSKYGLTPIESVGKPFDVEKHEALMQVEKKDVPSGTVVEEYEKGYMLNGEILRHAKVVVSK